MPILIRDAATERHAIIGLAAISSPVVQIAERDQNEATDILRSQLPNETLMYLVMASESAEMLRKRRYQR